MSIESLGFLGGGQMAEALIKGVIKAKLMTAESIIASDTSSQRLEFLSNTCGIRTSMNNDDIVKNAEVIVLAVKPDVVSACLTPLKHLFTPNHLLISICAGVSIATLQGILGSEHRITRVMPNTPCLVNECAAGYYCAGPHKTEDEKIVKSLFDSCGRAFAVSKESLIDSVTGLSGSGPAYVYMFIEALADGGVLNGLPRDIALQLAAQVVMGSAKMVLETGEHPAVLRNKVESPGGTTIAASAALEAGGMRAAVISAVNSATNRAQEIGKK
eukprot:TRINITY_DN15511_c0_g1::TRINITY_DN15511_c0_g1_i1::g.30446::m.30446 TRINITY_DN15511_c0_g1::TRINITY_DN15511_c0_g1_i1::g.30446  ORF type:complete len:272 (-),score=66.23,sp/Q9HH99/P5CR_METAC/46.49/5e-72,P5CR_dimer/PF14748.1/1e+04,P5CR_dimer/PF14748.1/2.2e-41,F420_oxidored/PF03807.12/1.1e-17,F420_oxidored/PF03807.12/1.2e+04,NAD_Gly3P_dh_N/PF01210.18/4.1e-05,PDH/PF02153.12/0.049,PDH/PF02153.12/9.4e+02 TRINITY_DN15511_c0_g1_i1:208-1023(-)